jgi:hypothetical protein
MIQKTTKTTINLSKTNQTPPSSHLRLERT